MTVKFIATETVEISDVKDLDTIHAFWINTDKGKGYVTIICYGQAWTSYFGGMSDRTIQRFFAECGADYLATKLGIAPHLKEGKKYDAYLGRIIKAVQSAIIGGGVPCA